MARIVSRVVVRLAIVAASLAWAGFVFTNTVGDPGRGERIATSVLADDAARAEVVAPITSAVMGATGLPPENRPFVSGQVDALLRDPEGARAFIDPFAGSYARMLGEDDPRPAEFDLAPLTDELTAGVPGLDTTALPTDRFEIPSVPLPRAELGWMAGVRSTVVTATTVLAIAALLGFAVGFAIGDRRRVLRRFGLWAALAGGGWVIVPVVLTWAAQRWASGADSVIAVGLGEAVGGLRATAIVLFVVGLAAFGASFVPLGLPAPDTERADARPSGGRRTAAPTRSAGHPSATEPTTVSPIVTPAASFEHRPRDSAPATYSHMRPSEPARRHPVPRSAMTTAEIPVTRRSDPPPTADELEAAFRGDRIDDEPDPLWEYYAP